MSNRDTLLACLAGMVVIAGKASATPECRGDWLNQAVSIEGLVFGEMEFRTELEDGLTFSLQPDPTGWRVEMLAEGDTPIPGRPVPSGIAPVKGQNDRSEAFVFGPDVLDPARNPERNARGQPQNIATVEPTPGKQGRVTLTSRDQAFLQTVPPRKVYMKFEACVRWNDGPRTPDTSHYPSATDDLVNFPGWVVTAFEDCGLPKSLLLNGRMARHGSRQRAWLEPDLDGDGRHDLVALVHRPQDNRDAIAACLQGGRTLVLGGLEPQPADTPLTGDFLAQANWWSVEARSFRLGIEGAGHQLVHLGETGRLTSRWDAD
jgi:hypothetical protein